VIRIDTGIWLKSLALSTLASRFAGIVTGVIDVNTFVLTTSGLFTEGVPVATSGTVMYVSTVTPGLLSTTNPADHSQPVCIIITSGASAILMPAIDSLRLHQWMIGDVSAGQTLSTTRYAFVYGSTGTLQATESTRNNIALEGAYNQFSLQTSTTQPASGSLVFTFRKAAVDQLIPVTVPAGSAAGTYSDLTNTVSATANQLISMKIVNNATTTGAVINDWKILYTET